MVDGIRISLDRGRQDSFLEASFDASVVGAVVLEAQLFLDVVAKDQGEMLRLDPLDGSHLFRIHTTLENCCGLRLPRQLGVSYLVAIVAQLARPVDPIEEVWMATPAAVRG